MGDSVSKPFKWAYKGRKLLSICLLLVVIFFSSRLPVKTMKLGTSKSYFSQVTREEINILSNAVLNGSDKTTKIVRVFTNTSEVKKIVPILISSMGGSGTTFLSNVFKSAGIKILHEAVGEDGTVGWWQLFNLNQLRVWERFLSMSKTTSSESAIAELRKKCASGGLWIVTNGRKYMKPCQKGSEIQFPPYDPSYQQHPVLYEKVFHQIRDPLKTISSFSKYCGHTQLWKMACTVTPDLIPHWSVDRKQSSRYKNNFNTCTKFMMYHWVSWNEKIAAYADWTYRIENTTIYSICTRAYRDHPGILRMCESNMITNGAESAAVRRNSKNFHGRIDLKPSHLYAIDCELARKVFIAAVSYGYVEYKHNINECQ